MYKRLEGYCAQLTARLTGSGAMRNAIGFFLNFLQLRFASSLYAIRCTLERRHDKVSHALRLSTVSPVDEPDEDLDQALFETDQGDEDACAAFLHWRTPADLTWEKLELESILEELRDLSARPSKFQVLLDSLQGRRQATCNRIRQTVVFTRFFDTLTDVALRLVAADRSMRFGWYSGPACRYRTPEAVDWIDTPREEVNGHFLRGDIGVLLCADAAADTARAHQLNRISDWVVIYASDDRHAEQQCTVVTETRGPLRGQRVVRGREPACAAYYRRLAAGSSTGPSLNATELSGNVANSAWRKT